MMVLTATDTTSNYGAKVNYGCYDSYRFSWYKNLLVQVKLMIIEGNGFGIKYDMGGGMTIAASTMEAEDDKDDLLAEEEKYTANIGEVVYTVAPGLKAKVTYT